MGAPTKLILLLGGLANFVFVSVAIFIVSQQESSEELVAPTDRIRLQSKKGGDSWARREASLAHASGTDDLRKRLGLTTSESELSAATSEINDTSKSLIVDLVGRLPGYPESLDLRDYQVELVYRRQHWESCKANFEDFWRALHDSSSPERVTVELARDGSFAFKRVPVGRDVSLSVKHRGDDIEPVSTVASFRVAEDNPKIELKATQLTSLELDFGGATLPLPKMKVVLHSLRQSGVNWSRGHCLQQLLPDLPSGDGHHVRTIPESGRVHVHGIVPGRYRVFLISEAARFEYDIFSPQEVEVYSVDLKYWFAETIEIHDLRSTRLSIGEVCAPAAFTVTDVHASGLEVRRQYRSGGESPGFRRAPYDGQIMVAGIAPGSYKFRLLYGPERSWGEDVGPWIRLRLNSGPNTYRATILER
jgi:hypothetical protein